MSGRSPEGWPVVTGSLGCQGCGGCTGLALTVPQEEDEVFGGHLGGLQLLGGVQGLGCLAVPEGWVLFLNWPKGEGGQVSFGERPVYEEHLGGVSLPGMMLRESRSLRPSSSSSSSSQTLCMPVGWWEDGRAGTMEGPGPWRCWHLGKADPAE